MRFREGAPNNSLCPFLPLPSSMSGISCCPLITTYSITWHGVLLRLRPFDVSDPVMAWGRSRTEGGWVKLRDKQNNDGKVEGLLTD